VEQNTKETAKQKVIKYVRRVKTQDEANEFFQDLEEFDRKKKELVRLISRFHPSDVLNQLTV
jgi:hypothetical protein